MLSQRLILRGPGDAAWEHAELARPGPGQVLFRPRLSTFKHGTEMQYYLGQGPFRDQVFDPVWRVFRPRTEPLYPMALGSMAVGRVVEVGPDVTQFRPGDEAFGWLPVADLHLCDAARLRPPDGLDDHAGVCLDPATFALGAVHDAETDLAGKVAFVTGLGAIAQFVIQALKGRGAVVLAASQFPLRRRLAEQFGADAVLPNGETPDLALAVKELTRRRWDRVGADVSFECSGRYDRLRHAIRATRQGGSVVMVGFYPGPASELCLGEEVFHNRLTLKASLPAMRWGNTTRGTPPLRNADLTREALELFRGGRLTARGLLEPVLPFAAAAEVCGLIERRPEDVIKVALRHD